MAPSSAERVDHRTILIADDDIVMRRLLQHYLRQAGYTVLCTINGAEAIERSLAQPDDLVITDLYMPFMNGLEVCRQINDGHRGHSVPVIMLSEPAERPSRQEIATSGIAAWITKPFNPYDLLSAVQQALNG